MRLDALDTAILAALVEDARRSIRDVAALVGSTPTTVSARFERLKELGVVRGASVRLDPGATPGRPRLLTGRVPRERNDAVAHAAAQTAGILHAAVAGDGRLVAFLQVLDLDDEERVVRVLTDAGAEEVAVVAVRRVEGPAPVHLFSGEQVIAEACAVCAKETGADPVTETVDARRVVFCCPSCRKLYMERYEALRKAAQGPGRSTTS